MKLTDTCLRSNLNNKKLSNLMKIALESSVELTDGHLEEIVDVWNRKSSGSLCEFDTMYIVHNGDNICNTTYVDIQTHIIYITILQFHSILQFLLVYLSET